MNNRNFFKDFYYSLFKFDYYKNFINQNFGKSIAFITLFSLIISVFNGISFLFSLNSFANDLNTVIEKQIPHFTFDKGELNFENSKDMPLIYNDGEDNIIIDTRDNTDKSILDEYDAGILITKNKIVQKQNSQTKVTDLSEFKDLSFSKEDLYQYVPYIKALSPVLAIFIFIGVIIAYLFYALLLSLLGLIFNSVNKSNLTYSQIFNLSIYSLTLILFLEFLPLGAITSISFIQNVPIYIVFLVSGFYLFMSIKKLNSNKITLEK